MYTTVLYRTAIVFIAAVQYNTYCSTVHFVFLTRHLLCLLVQYYDTDCTTQDLNNMKYKILRVYFLTRNISVIAMLLWDLC